MTSDRLGLGDIEVYGLRDGFFYLDGGAMFGVVPKTLWEKKCPADARNRIRLGLNSLPIKTPLHCAHCGGNTLRNEKGEVVPAFPRARYIIQKGEWEWAMNPHEREKGSYPAENSRPQADYGLLGLVDGNSPV